MTQNGLRWGAMALLWVGTGACAIGPAIPGRREALARQIADDAVAFNEAYARSVSGQILLNILRARDRQPRHYLSMSGIQDAPSIRFREAGTASSIPLGEGASPWGFGSVTLERESQSRPSYALQPFGPEALTRVAFQPTSVNVFAHYWNSGWPRDLLMLLLVETISVAGPEGSFTTVTNDAAVIRADCVGAAAGASGCAFVVTARTLLAEIERLPERPIPPQRCGLVGVFGEGAPPPEATECRVRISVNGKIYTLGLRSLDDAVYYVGELLRETDGPAGDVLEAAVTVKAAGVASEADVRAPLFRVVDLGGGWFADPGGFAASAVYQGRRYASGPPVGRNCAAVSPKGACAADPALGDRSSSVLSLMAELFALNQSPDALRPPARLIAE
jgi:hypothetical protein